MICLNQLRHTKNDVSFFHIYAVFRENTFFELRNMFKSNFSTRFFRRARDNERLFVYLARKS